MRQVADYFQATSFLYIMDWQILWMLALSLLVSENRVLILGRSGELLSLLFIDALDARLEHSVF